MRRVSLFFLLAVLLVRPAVAENAALVPGNTYALIVGVLKWEQSSLATYSPVQRQDVALYEQLKTIGVPEKNMTMLLDGDATREKIETSLAGLAKQAESGATLIVYYAGHGMYCKDQGVFANYDIRTDQLEDTGWCHDNLTEIVQSNFQGDRVLLLADCCFSGSLERVAGKLHTAGFRAASITSASPINASTNNWTFTLALVDILKGQPLADLNDDGAISIAEASVEVGQAMRFYEAQPSGSSLHGVAEDFRLVPARSATVDEKQFVNFQPGDYVQANFRGKWRPARLMDRNGDQFSVRIQQYNSYRTEWLPLADVRPARQLSLAVETPPTLSEEEALIKASVGGKYNKLLKKIGVPSDFGSVGEFYDWGAWSGTQWGGHTDLPAGFWVYVYPNWYIWGQSDEPDAAPAAEPVYTLQPLEPSSSSSVGSFDPLQMTGEPDTPQAGDYGTCWAAAEMDGRREWLELRYASAVIPESVWVYENMAPGAVYQVTGFIDGEEVLLWRGLDPVARSAAKGISKIKLDTTHPLQRIRVYLDCKGVTGWNEIDAVGLRDLKGEIHWATDALASSSYGNSTSVEFVDPFMSPQQTAMERLHALEAEMKAQTSRIEAITRSLAEARATMQRLKKDIKEVKANLQ